MPCMLARRGNAFAGFVGPFAQVQQTKIKNNKWVMSFSESHEHIVVLNPNIVRPGRTQCRHTEVLSRTDVKLSAVPRAGHNKSVNFSTSQWVARVRTNVVKGEDLIVVSE